MKQSSMTRFLKGKVIPGQPGAVVNITVKGNTRLVSLSTGEVVKKDKRTILKAFHQVLAKEQATKAKKSIRVAPDGKASVTLGGTQKGVRKTYASKANALRAIERHHGKKK